MDKLITPAASYPISLNDAKAHLKVDGSSEDDLITSYLASATATVQRLANVVMMPTVWELHLPWFGENGWLVLPYGPVVSVGFVKYYAYGAGSLSTLDSGQYHLMNGYRQKAIIEPAFSSGWEGYPSVDVRSDAVQCRYTAGFSVQNDNLLQALRLMLGAYHHCRSTTIVGTIATQMALGAERLCRLERIY